MTARHTEMFATVKKAPGFVAVVLACLAVLAWFGFRVQMPGERLESHLTASDSAHRAMEARFEAGHEHDEQMETLLQGMVRGECIENPRENLARQGLLPTCQKLGIVP